MTLHTQQPQTIESLFQSYDWEPFAFQRESWAAYLAGESGLVHAPTGMGKTLSVWLGPVQEWLTENPERTHWPRGNEAIRLLWLTPLRALAVDTVASLQAPILDMAIPWSVEGRTGDTSSSTKARQKERLPTALVTTPESLSLLLSYPNARELFSTLRCVVVDEWHELLGTKRGVQTELGIARLRNWNPKLRIWGLSATLGNLEEARDVLLGGSQGRLIRGAEQKAVEVETLFPADMERFPWAGHLGTKLVEPVAERIDGAASTLLFTNTRSQAELWFRALLEARPQWAESIALHHGSLARDQREEVENGLREGTLKCVVCTSSLDLGVDFSPVDLVVQIGSPKGIGRLLQRAGRSGHRPGATSRVLCVPTNAFEMIEFSAARNAFAERRIEPRCPLEKPLDLLVQHLVTMALGGGFTEEEAYDEVRTAWAFRHLTREEFGWALDFVVRGGPALRAYPQYARLGLSREGRYVPVNEDVGRSHRMAIGTITSDSAVAIRYQRGATLGSVEEYFIARLKPGDRFLFAGKTLELIRVKAMVAEVKRANGRASAVPSWQGGKMPLSTLLADEVRSRIDEARRDIFKDREMEEVRALLQIQQTNSIIPEPGELLIEVVRTREGWHAFVFPFAGRGVHEGLVNLIAMRLSRLTPRTITMMINDYGFQMLSRSEFPTAAEDWRGLFAMEGLLEDLLACVNTNELARRRFRDIARVAGLVLDGYPGQRRSAKQLQTSSALLFDVFSRFDPSNMLLEEARRAVLREQLDYATMERCLEKIGGMSLRVLQPERLSPLAFPLWAESIRSHVSTEDWESRVRAMVADLESHATGKRP
jgi:ATP-dependent Lhr-like helicase